MTPTDKDMETARGIFDAAVAANLYGGDGLAIIAAALKAERERCAPEIDRLKADNALLLDNLQTILHGALSFIEDIMPLVPEPQRSELRKHANNIRRALDKEHHHD